MHLREQLCSDWALRNSATPDVNHVYPPLSSNEIVLAIDAKDKDALHCKAVTLIRLERYTDALTILNRPLEGKFVFEKAYCLYRTNQLSDGATLIESRRKELKAQGQTLSWDLRHLEAQMLYRMERYQECIELYYGMLKDTPKSDEGYNDILTNFNACKAAVLYSGEALDDRVRMRSTILVLLDCTIDEVPILTILPFVVFIDLC